MTPKFSVGEIVILNRKKNPDEDGEYEVLGVELFKGTTSEQKPYEGYIYDLGFIPKGNNNPWFTEPLLRKKHQPGSMDFQQLVNWMKQPQKLLTHNP